MQNNLATSSFQNHFTELKSRLLKIVAIFIISFSICFYFKDFLFTQLANPLTDILAEDQQFIYTHLAEAFIVYLKLALWGAIFITIPFASIQLYLFIAPGLYKEEKRFVIPTFMFSFILFYAGLAFVYLFLMPKAWEFFLNFANASTLDISLQAKVSEYLNFCLQLMLAFGLAFQMPVLLIILAKIGLVDSKLLVKARKYAILFIAIASALLTPPDIISQIALIVPLVIMYEVTILLLKVNNRSKIKKEV